MRQSAAQEREMEKKARDSEKDDQMDRRDSDVALFLDGEEESKDESGGGGLPLPWIS